jgi:hypothetical protein
MRQALALPSLSDATGRWGGLCLHLSRVARCAPPAGRRAVGLIGAVLFLSLWVGICAIPAAAEDQTDDGERSSLTEGAVAELSEEQLAATKAAIAAVDHYMVALKAVHRWQDAVTPVERRRSSRFLRRELGGSEAPDLALAQRKWREARTTLEGAPGAAGAVADLWGAMFQAIQKALDAAGDFRLVGAELDPEFFASGSLKLCLADERMLQVVQGLHRFLTGLREDAGAAELLALHGTDLELHAAYLRTKGCRSGS